MLGRALVDLTHLADIGHITLLMPRTHDSNAHPQAKRLTEMWEAEFQRLFSYEARPDVEVEWHDPDALTARHAAAGSAIILQDLLRRISISSTSR